MNIKIAKSGLTKEKLRELYLDQKLSQALIAIKYGVCWRTIGAWLKKWRIPMRSRMEGILLAYESGRHPTGANHPKWKGGHYLHSSGYWMVRDTSKRGRMSGYKKYIPEHIKVWKEAHGREVPQGWQVHHINGDKEDNRKENLIALRSKDHRRIIPALQERIRKLERRL